MSAPPSGSREAEPFSVTPVWAEATVCADPAFTTGGRSTGPAGLPQASNSARPTLCVVAETLSTVNRTQVTVRAANVTGTPAADPALPLVLVSAPTATDVPSEKVSVPPVI